MNHQRAGRIILVRHGETEANRRGCFAESNDIPLTEAGRLQAHQLALRLSLEFRPSLLFSSGYLRAKETTEIIARELKLGAEVIDGIHERDFGCLKGHPYGRMGELMSIDIVYDPARAWLWTPPGGESLEDVRLRAAAVLEMLRVKHEGRQIVLVCHGAVIQALCAHITGEWSEAYVPPNCGIVAIDYVEDAWQHPVKSSDWECIPIYRNSRL